MSRIAAPILSASLAFLLTIPGLAATVEADVISASLVPSRTEGMAPLPVFFDATATELASGSLHNARFFWDFNDPSSPHPTASGFVSAHVFEQPGEYTVRLTITDATGPKVVTSVKITVNPFVGATYYVSSSLGNDTNNGLSERSPFKTFDHAMAKLKSVLGGGPAAVRLLFRRADTFTTDGVILSGCHGTPAILGAYGSGNRPLIQVSPTEIDVLNFLADNSGFRFLDLELRGNYSFTSRTGPCQTLIALYSRNHDFLLLRVHMQHSGLGFAMAGGENLKDIFIVDSAFTEVWGQGIYAGGSQLAIIGNEIIKSAYTHLLRVWRADKAFISRNVLRYPSFETNRGRHALKLHADGGHTRHVVVSENEFLGSSWSVTIAPQDTRAIEYLEHIVFERNRILSDSLTNVGLVVIANDVTIRNNLFVRDACTSLEAYTPIRISTHEILPDSQRITVHNNTACDFRASYEAHFLEIYTTGTGGVDLKNNLFYAPHALGNSVGIWSASPLSGLTADHNLWYIPRNDGLVAYQPSGNVGYTLAAWQKIGKGLHSRIDDPKLGDPLHGNHRPVAGSPAIDGGTGSVGVFEAIDGERRPLGASTDIGAFESVSPGTTGRVQLDATPAAPNPGGTVSFDLQATGYSGKLYQVGLAFASYPPIQLEPISIPLNPDVLYYYSVRRPSAQGFENLVGPVSSGGGATARMRLPASPAIHGLSFYAAALIWDGPQIVAGSNPVFVLVQ